MIKDFFLRPRVIAWILFITIFSIIIFQNVEPITFKVLFWSFLSLPKLVLILLSMLLGSILTLIISWDIRHSKQKRDTQLPSMT